MDFDKRFYLFALQILLVELLQDLFVLQLHEKIRRGKPHKVFDEISFSYSTTAVKSDEL